MSQTVTFTEDPADQELLEAIAEEIADQTFESFEHLCKEALRYFLFEDDMLPTTQLEQVLATQDSTQAAQIEQHLGQIIQRLEQIESLVGQPIAALQHQVASLAQALAPQVTESTVPCDQPHAVELSERQSPGANDSVSEEVTPLADNSTQKTANPRLNRLSALLEDF